MDLQAWALVFTAVATSLSAGSVAWQVFLFRHQQEDLLSLETEGVGVTWHALTPPNDGHPNIWKYPFTASNPGRFPISDVNVVVSFPVPVVRVRHSGALDAASQTVPVGTPVLLGGATCTWTRTLRIEPDPGDCLRYATATISFVSSRGVRKVNSWPRREPA